MSPEGDDVGASASNGALPFRNVQPALDFADANRGVATHVCVAGAADCSTRSVYPGPTGDLTMRDGIGLHGSYETTSWGRCEATTTVLAPTTSNGIYFPPAIQAHTVLDRMEITPGGAGIAAGVTLDGARNVELSRVSVYSLSGLTDAIGVDLRSGAEAALNELSITLVASSELFGLRAFDSSPSLIDSSVYLQTSGPATGIVLERTVAPTIERSSITLRTGAGATGVGVRVLGGEHPELSGGSIVVMGAGDQYGIDLIDAGEAHVAGTRVSLDDGIGTGFGIRSIRSHLVSTATTDVGMTEGTAYGAVLEDSPGSSLGSASAGAPELAVGVYVTGALDGVSTGDARAGSQGEGYGALLEDCDPGTVTFGTVSVSASKTTQVARGILARDACPVRVQGANVVMTGTDADLVGIDCSSNCSIVGNTVQLSSVRNLGGGPRLYKAIECPGCVEISENSYAGLALSGLQRSAIDYSYGIVGGALIARNRITAGCGDQAIGIDGGGRIENNIIRGGSGCTPAALVEGSALVFLSIGVRGGADVHSNEIEAGSTVDAPVVTPFCENVGIQGAALVRNNSVSGGPFCTSLAASASGTLENNALGAGVRTAMGEILTAEELNDRPDLNASGNFSGACGFRLYPTSRCVDAGTTTGAPAADIDGDSRTETPPDIGADELPAGQNLCAGVDCSGHGICRSNPEPHCECAPGYEQVAGDALACADTDECAVNNGGCDPVVTCTNLPGSRSCGECPPGYTGDGETGCIACGDNPCQNGGICVASLGTCDCPPGTRGSRCEELIFSDVSAGSENTCGLEQSGAIHCWGSRLLAPLGTFRSIGPGAYQRCAIRADDSVACWPAGNSVGVAGPPSGPFQAVASGLDFSCGVRQSGTLFCWGTNQQGALEPPSGNFQGIAAGERGACALRTDGSVACWGSLQGTPPPAGTFVAITAYGSRACGVRADGSIACWGPAGPVNDPPSGEFQAISVGQDFACALRTDGSLACWGNDADGQADPPAGVFASVSAGRDHACAVSADGPAVCWGSDSGGKATLPGGTFKSISAPLDETACAVRLGGSVSCWLPRGHEPPPAGEFTSVSNSFDNACALRTDGTIACWGDAYGQLSPPAGVFTAVETGGTHGCALDALGAIQCFGDDSVGQSSPPPFAFTQLSLSYQQSCGLRTDGMLACWGAREQLFDVPFLSVAVGGPSSICAIDGEHHLTCIGGELAPPSGEFQSVSAAYLHACGLRTDGTLACWGRNEKGQSSPPSGTFRAVAVGQRDESTSCAIRADGAIQCWGAFSRMTTCADQPDAAACQFCPSGYWNAGSGTCLDVDECQQQACDPLTTCWNTPGSYVCGSCPAGYTGTGETGCVPL